MKQYFNEDTIEDLVEVAKTEGWQVMMRDAYTFVDVDCDWKDQSDKIMLTKILISRVGYRLTNR